MDAPPLLEVFEERERAFLASLEQATTVVASDEYIKQMFRDKVSVMYTPQRVCEIIKEVIVDDREQFITTLLTKLSNIEICLGREHMNDLAVIGEELASLPDKSDEKKVELMARLADIVSSNKEAVSCQKTIKAQSLSNGIKQQVSEARMAMNKFRSDVADELDASKSRLALMIKAEMGKRNESERDRTMAVDCTERVKQLEATLARGAEKYNRMRDRAKQGIDELSRELATTKSELEKLRTQREFLGGTGDESRSVKSKYKSNDLNSDADVKKAIEKNTALNDNVRSLEEKLHTVEIGRAHV